MIALRAAHTAFRIATDLGYPRINADRAFCPSCGTELNWRERAIGTTIFCPSCGKPTEVPPHLRAKLLPQERKREELDDVGVARYPRREGLLGAWVYLFILLAMLTLVIGLIVSDMISRGVVR
jgi:hypothetical protein